MKRHAVVIALLLLALAPGLAQACPVCFGDPNAPMVKGTSNGIMFLLGIVGFVQIAFAALFFTFWKRAKELRRRERFELIPGGRA